MAVNTILNSVSTALIQPTASASTRPAATASQIVDNVTKVSSEASTIGPSQSTVQNASLLNAASGLSQASSLLQVAQSGADQASVILQQLQALAEQVTSGGDSTGLDSEFQHLLSQLGEVASGTNFGGTNLLDGTLSANSAGVGATNSQEATASLSLPDLSTQALLGSATADISTPQNAANIASVLASAQTTTGNTSDAITNVLGQLDYASASINSALFNTIAATSTLTENDLSNEPNTEAYANLLANPTSTIQTQTSKLPSDLLNLVQE